MEMNPCTNLVYRDLDQAMSGPSDSYRRPPGLPPMGAFTDQGGQSYASEVAVPDYMADPWLRPQGDPWLNSSYPIPQMADHALAPIDATHGFGGTSEDLTERATQEMHNAGHGLNWMGDDAEEYELTAAEANRPDVFASPGSNYIFAPSVFDAGNAFADIFGSSSRARQEAVAAANSANSFIRQRTPGQDRPQQLSDRVTFNYESLPANPASAPPAATTLRGFRQVHNWDENQGFLPTFPQFNQCTEV